MDALLLSLLLCLLLSLESRLSALLPAGRGRAFSRLLLLAGMALAAAAWAMAGAALTPVMTPEARRLFLALALAIESMLLLAGGIGRRRTREPNRGALLIDGLADIASGGGAFLIVAIAAAFADPWMAGLGGWIGRATALMMAPQLALLNGWRHALRTLQLVGGSLGIIAGLFLAMSALRFV